MPTATDARQDNRPGSRNWWHRRVLSTPLRLMSWLISGAEVDARPVVRLERVLSVGRAFLTVSALAAIYLDPSQPTRLAAVTYAVLAAYAVFSVSVLVYVHRTPRLSGAHGHLLHGCDVLWTAALTFVSEGPVSPFFLFFLFVVLSAAYRWGFAGTVVTTCVTVAIFLAQTLVAAAGPWRQVWLTSINFEIDETILRVAYLLLTGVLLGYLAEQEKQSRAELAQLPTSRVSRGWNWGSAGRSSLSRRRYGGRSMPIVCTSCSRITRRGSCRCGASIAPLRRSSLIHRGRSSRATTSERGSSRIRDGPGPRRRRPARSSRRT